MIECVLTTIADLAPSIADTTSQYLPNNSLACIILFVHLETNLLEKFNLNLDYILKKTSDPDNQDNTLYRASYQKLMDIFWSDNFLTGNSRDKLWSFVPTKIAFSW